MVNVKLKEKVRKSRYTWTYVFVFEEDVINDSRFEITTIKQLDSNFVNNIIPFDKFMELFNELVID